MKSITAAFTKKKKPKSKDKPKRTLATRGGY